MVMKLKIKFLAWITGGWEKKSMKLWVQLCKESKVILDIGANNGVYALTGWSINPAAEVYAFEPLQRIFLKLQKNCDLNHFDIHCIQKALSDKEGEQIIYENDNPHINASTLNRTTAVNYGQGLLGKETIINTTTLDKFIGSEILQRVDLVKIDVETHESQVIDGFKNFLPKFKPAFIIEILVDEVGRKIQEVFDPLGYLYFNIDDNNDSVRLTEMLRKSNYFNYLICTKETAKKLGLIEG